MSHFATLVLLRSPAGNGRLPTPREVAGDLARLLAPFDANLTVEPYETACACASTSAWTQATADANARFGEDFASMRRRVQAEIAAELGPAPVAHWYRPGSSRASKEYEARASAAWNARSRQRIDWEAARRRELEATMPPDPECEECGGSGRCTTDRNPLAKLDWFEVGGRFHRAAGDVLRVSDLLTSPHAADHSLEPAALLTPDGSWREIEDFWSLDPAAATIERWRETVRSTLALHPDAIAVLVDCHL